VGAAYTAAASAAVAGAPFRSPDLPPHVSLSRTLMLRFEEIEEMAARLRTAIAGVPPFAAALEGARVLVSDDCARSFVSLVVCAGGEQLRELTRRVDAVAARHRLPAYYDVRGGSGVVWRARPASAHVVEKPLSFHLTRRNQLSRTHPTPQPPLFHASFACADGDVTAACAQRGTAASPELRGASTAQRLQAGRATKTSANSAAREVVVSPEDIVHALDVAPRIEWVTEEICFRAGNREFSFSLH